MQVRVCPKCGAENRPDRASCSNCYTSLEAVAETEAKPRPVPTQPRAEAPNQPVSASPLTGPAVTAGPTPADNYAPPPGAPSPYGPPPAFERRLAPTSRGPNWIAIILTIVILAGAGCGGWWAYYKFLRRGPEQVVQNYIDATKTRDFETMKACLSQSTLNLMQMAGSEEEFKKEFFRSGNSNEFDGKITGCTYDKSNSSLAYVNFEPTSKKNLPPDVTSIEIVCCREDGKWKVDLVATSVRMMKKVFSSMGR